MACSPSHTDRALGTVNSDKVLAQIASGDNRLGPGLQAWHAYQISVRPTLRRLSLILNVTIVPFYEPGNLAEHAKAVWGPGLGRCHVDTYRLLVHAILSVIGQKPWQTTTTATIGPKIGQSIYTLRLASPGPDI